MDFAICYLQLSLLGSLKIMRLKIFICTKVISLKCSISMRMPVIASMFKFITNLWTISVRSSANAFACKNASKWKSVCRHGTTINIKDSWTSCTTINLITQSKWKLFEEVKPKCRFKSWYIASMRCKKSVKHTTLVCQQFVPTPKESVRRLASINCAW